MEKISFQVIALWMILANCFQNVHAMYFFSRETNAEKWQRIIQKIGEQKYSVIRGELYPLLNGFAKNVPEGQDITFLFNIKQYVDATLDVPCMYLWVRYLKDVKVKKTQHIQLLKRWTVDYETKQDIDKDIIYYMALCLLRIAEDIYICRHVALSAYKDSVTYRSKIPPFRCHTYELYDVVKQKFQTWLKKIYENHIPYFTDPLEKAAQALQQRHNAKFFNSLYVLSYRYEGLDSIMFYDFDQKMRQKMNANQFVYSWISQEGVSARKKIMGGPYSKRFNCSIKRFFEYTIVDLIGEYPKTISHNDTWYK